MLELYAFKQEGGGRGGGGKLYKLHNTSTKEVILNPSRTLTIFETQPPQVRTPSDCRHQFLTLLQNELKNNKE